MGVFDDKKFEELDWMTQVTETIESGINSVLAQMPDKIKLDFDTIASYLDSGYGLSLSPSTVARGVMKNIPDRPKLSWEEERTVTGCFELEISDNFSIDFENNTMEGEIHLIKAVTTIDDDVLQKYMGSEGIQQLSRISYSSVNVSRVNEIMELLGGLEDALRGRSWRRKHDAMRRRLMNIFKNNEWRIRDTALANKVGYWVCDYITSGNLAAFSNFCRLKVMTHQNMPIYSIEEQE